VDWKKVPAMMYDDSGWGWWMMGIGVALLLLLVAAAVVAVVFAARPPSEHPYAGPVAPPSQPRRSEPSAQALAELDVRFARGEVDEDTYRRSRDLLTHPPA
jgi:uncharacterized membrane protein